MLLGDTDEEIEAILSCFVKILKGLTYDLMMGRSYFCNVTEKNISDEENLCCH